MLDVLISFLFALAIVGACFYFFSRPAQNVGPVSVQQATNGEVQTESQESLPRSLNQKGLELSTSVWVKIDDFEYKYGTKKVIFTKGSADLNSACPSLLLDGLSNTLLVHVDTFGGTDVIPISNIPAKKWLLVCIVIQEHSVDVYINGELKTHHTLSQLPKQNDSAIRTGLQGGFAGQIADLNYYPYALTSEQISKQFSTPPSGGSVTFAPSWFS